MKRVEIFRTYVQHAHQAEKICKILSQKLTDKVVNFDLDDCDKILRIESVYIDTLRIQHIMEILGYSCDLIPVGGFCDQSGEDSW